VVEGGPATVVDGLLAEGCTVMVPTFEGKLPAIPSIVFGKPDKVQGDHPICSFTAVGPLAYKLIGGQKPMDVYAPLRALIAYDGLVVLMGIWLDKMTLIHLAEQMAGRRLFSHHQGGVECETGGCSKGFGKLEPFLESLYWQGWVGKSIWSVFLAKATVMKAKQVIENNPMITHCGDRECQRCNTATGGRWSSVL
jgi:aminoglycoside 3-N-acetyltransferase